MEREFISFEVASDLAHFRRQYAITTALTYPAPPRTALCGLVGALLGLRKNDGLAQLGDDDAVFGFQMLEPLRTGHISINLVNTKRGLLGWRKDENPHSAMRYEVIREPRYRVLFSHADLGPQLYQTLLAGEAYYVPCLGLAWMLASVEGEPRRLLAKESTSDAVIDYFSPVRTDAIKAELEWSNDRRYVYQRVRMPAVMQPDRQVTRYQEYVIETTGRPIRARLDSYWQLEDDSAFSAM
jgi:CRISPR-associated protein Cas5h